MSESIDIPALLATLAAAAIAVNRVIELLKPALHTDRIPEAYRPYAVYFASVLASLITVFGIGDAANLLSISPRFAFVPDALGLVLTAFVLAAGANWLHAFAGLLAGREVPPQILPPYTKFVN